MMTMIFQFSQNSHTHRIVVNEKDVLLEWKRMKGDAFVKVRFTKCIIPKGSDYTNHGKAISGKPLQNETNFSVQTVRRRVKLLARVISIGNMRLLRKIMKCQTKRGSR